MSRDKRASGRPTGEQLATGPPKKPAAVHFQSALPLALSSVGMKRPRELTSPPARATNEEQGRGTTSLFPVDPPICVVPGGREVGTKHASILSGIVERGGGTVFAPSDLISHLARGDRSSRGVIVASGAATLQDLARFAVAVQQSNHHQRCYSADEVACALKKSPGWAQCVSVQWIMDSAKSGARTPLDHYMLCCDNEASTSATAAPRSPSSIIIAPSVQQRPATTTTNSSSGAKEGFVPVFFPGPHGAYETPPPRPSTLLSLLSRQDEALTLRQPASPPGGRSSDECATWTSPPMPSLRADDDDPPVRSSGYACQRSADGTSIHHSSPNPNATLIGKLEELSAVYEATGDHWRRYAYSRAIGIIKRHGHRLISSSADLKHYRGIGARILVKIDEILATGTASKLEFLHGREEVRATEAFAHIWGVGPATSHRLVQRGLRSIDDLRRCSDLSTVLSPTQLIGLRHYEDLQHRIPRSEVRLIEGAVAAALYFAVPSVPVHLGEIEGASPTAPGSHQVGIEVVTCGSYRRGKATCGDVDVLLCDRSGRMSDGILRVVIEALERRGFIVGHLSRGASSSWMGVVQVPDCSGGASSSCPCAHRDSAATVDDDDVPHRYLQGVHMVRRLDIKVYPAEEFAFAVLYFTGSDYFNRSMRLFCHRKGLSLSDRSLTPVIRSSVRRERVHEFAAQAVECRSERDIFAAVGLPYKNPSERDL